MGEADRSPNLDEQVAGLVATLTPERIEQVARQLAAARPGRLRSGITAHELIDALLGPVEGASGAEMWRVRLKIKAALQATIATMPNLTFVEGDA